MRFLTSINLILWSGPLLILLLSTHLIMTVRYRFPQRHLWLGLRLLFEKENRSTLTTTLAATLGTGNIIGVGTAVFFGGPGAVFWCWITGVFGMATTYAESYLALSPLRKNSSRGGTMYLIRDVLGCKKLASFYAFFVCCSAFFVGCLTQSNAIASVCRDQVPIPAYIIGLILAFFVGLVLFRGLSQIESFCMFLVPFMSVLFFGSCLAVMILNHSLLKSAILLIIRSAFSQVSFCGGLVGFSIAQCARYGIARGLFTNEAGLGTAGIVAGSKPCINHIGQSAVSMCATFFDTVILCGITGIVVVLFLLRNPDLLLSGAADTLARKAFSIIPGIGELLLAIEIFCFALATLIGWSYIGWQAADFLGGKRFLLFYRLIYLIMIVIGTILPLQFVWELTDFINIFLVIPCVLTLLLIRPSRSHSY